MTIMQAITGRESFETVYGELCHQLLKAPQRDRGAVHAQANDQLMFELNHVVLTMPISSTLENWQLMTLPNLPWAEDHFLERISGKPLNPPPSASWWPYNQKDNEVHKKNQKFSHTYPERFWSQYPEVGEPDDFYREGGPMMGIRFRYGDLFDLIKILQKNRWTRQAYLPVWFPEDLAATVDGERVPCTLGYHFLQTEEGKLDCTYFLRSCDIVRFFRDDVYMAGRLAQYVGSMTGLVPGELVMHISNLHAFDGDQYFLTQQFDPKKVSLDFRVSYNFEALS